MPTISVIVPVYKVEPYLNRCVDSILRQTYQDFELILVDDGSPDRCGEICDEYARQDSRVHVIHKENGGLSDARNAGIDWVEANSDSRWLIFADSDDWVHPELLARLLDAATAFDLKISVCGYQETEGADPAVLPEDMRPCRWTPKRFYMGHFVNATVAWGKLYSRSCFRDIRYPVGKIHEDEFVTYRLLFAQKEIAVVPAPLYAYFINPKGIIRSAWSPKRFHAWEAYDQQLAFFTAMGDEKLVKFRVRGYLDNALANLHTAEQADNAAELTAEEAHFLLQPFHAFQHMMNGVDAFDIDREIVIQVAISFQFPELGGEKIPFAVDGAYFDQPSFFERNNKSRVGMALLAIFVENN